MCDWILAHGNSKSDTEEWKDTGSISLLISVSVLGDDGLL